MTSRKRILIIDDDPEVRETLKDIVESVGHATETACDGFEALTKVQMEPDLILLDLAMPGIDGYEVTRRIRQDPETADIPIIVVAALDGREDRLRAVEAGDNDFIAKPADLVEVRTRTASLLKFKETQDRLKRREKELEEAVQHRTAQL